MQFTIEYGIQASQGPVWWTKEKDPLYESATFTIEEKVGNLQLEDRTITLPDRKAHECVEIARNYTEQYMNKQAMTNNNLKFIRNHSHVAHNLLNKPWIAITVWGGITKYSKTIRTANKRWYIELTWDKPWYI